VKQKVVFCTKFRKNQREAVASIKENLPPTVFEVNLECMFFFFLVLVLVFSLYI
jgi:hypothetical protein